MRAFRTAMKLDETSVAALTGQTTIVSSEMSPCYQIFCFSFKGVVSLSDNIKREGK